MREETRPGRCTTMVMDDDATRFAADPASGSDGGARGGAHARGGGMPVRHVDDDTTYRYLPPRPVVEPSLVFEPPKPRRRHGDPSLFKDMGLLLFVVAAIVAGFATWGFAGRLTSSLMASTPTAAPIVAPSPSARGGASAAPAATSSQSPSPTDAEPTDEPPAREATSVNVESRPRKVFVSELEKTWCAAAAVQIVLNVNGSDIDTSRRFQARIHDLERTYTSRTDSHNGGVGPMGMAKTLNRLGDVQYELRIYRTRAEALHEAASAVSSTGHPVILLAWRGAHAWVMTGFEADADPAVFADAKIGGTYILDPWYPRLSRIWGPSDPPGTFQDAAEMKRNYLAWRRPEGHYPGRDGRYLAIIPADAP